MKPYKSYFYRGQDPLLTEAIGRIMATGTKFSKLSKDTGVATTTFYNWKKRKSKRTYASTMNAALHGAGMELKIVKGNGKG